MKRKPPGGVDEDIEQLRNTITQSIATMENNNTYKDIHTQSHSTNTFNMHTNSNTHVECTHAPLTTPNNTPHETHAHRTHTIQFHGVHNTVRTD